jgi:hypothetical protein
MTIEAPDQWVRPTKAPPLAWANALTDGPAAQPTSPVLVYTYADVAAFNDAAAYMALGGYYPIAQSMEAPIVHRHGLAITALAVLLSPFTFFLSLVVGLLLYAVWTTSTPGGLTVTYGLRP